MWRCGLIIVLPLTHETIIKFKFCQWYLTIKILSPWEESNEPSWTKWVIDWSKSQSEYSRDVFKNAWIMYNLKKIHSVIFVNEKIKEDFFYNSKRRESKISLWSRLLNQQVLVSFTWNCDWNNNVVQGILA